MYAWERIRLKGNFSVNHEFLYFTLLLDQLSPIPFILSNDDDDTDKENEHLEIVY